MSFPYTQRHSSATGARCLSIRIRALRASCESIAELLDQQPGRSLAGQAPQQRCETAEEQCTVHDHEAVAFRGLKSDQGETGGGRDG